MHLLQYYVSSYIILFLIDASFYVNVFTKKNYIKLFVICIQESEFVWRQFVDDSNERIRLIRFFFLYT